MRKLLLPMWLFVMAAALSAWGAERPGAPAIALRVNGRGAGGETPLEMWRGEPVIIEVVLRHRDRAAKESIVLEPPDGGWSARVKVVVTDAGGSPAKWPFVVTGKPSRGALALRPDTVTTVVLRMELAAWAAVAGGNYTVVARLDLADGKGWRGTIDSEPAGVLVLDAPAEPKDSLLGRRQLLRVKDALLAGDVERAQAAANEMLRADARRPEGFVAMGLIAEAKGERELALAAIDMAIARAAGAEVPMPEATGKAPAGNAPAAPAVKGKPVPFEYYDLRHRFEKMPEKTVPNGREK